MAPSAKFEIPVLSDNPEGWGPTSTSDQFKDIPYAPFNKGDRIGRAADWTQQGFRGRYDRDNRGGAGGTNLAFSFFHNPEDEDSFQLVDSKPGMRQRYGPRRFYQQQNRFGGRGRGPDVRRDGRDSGAGADRERQRRERVQLHKRGQWSNPYYNRDALRANLTSSVEVRPEWVVLEQMSLSSLAKETSPDVGEPKDVATCGSLEYYDKAYDRVTPKNEKPLERFESRQFHKVTTSDDPILLRLASSLETEGEQETSQKKGAAAAEDAAAKPPPVVVLATDTIVSTIMCAVRSVYSWDVVVQKSGNKIFLDQRDGSFDLLTVNETGTPTEPPPEEGINSVASLSQEATFINQNFSQQVLAKGGSKYEFKEKNPFAVEGEEVASVAYKYRKWKLNNDTVLIARCELDAVMEMKGQEMFITVNSLNEFDPKVTGMDWRAKIENQKGAVFATELKNNSNKLAKWTAQALLAGADMMKLGYVSRSYPRDNLRHGILAVQAYKPKELANQIALSSSHMWGVFKAIVEMCKKLSDGRYLLLKDPNKPILRLYDVPADAFEDDYAEEPLPEDEQAAAPIPEGEEEEEEEKEASKEEAEKM